MIFKICGLKNKESLLCCEENNADFFGMIFYEKSPRNITFDEARILISASKKMRIRPVGVFVDHEINDLKEIIASLDLKHIQLHGNEDEKFCKELSSFCNVIKAFRIDDTFDLNDIEKYSKYCKYFLFDTFTESYGGSGKKFNWDLLLNYDHKKDFILSGGINLELISSIKKLKNQLPNLIGVDLNSKFEIKPGLKDINRVKKFIKSIKNENT